MASRTALLLALALAGGSCSHPPPAPSGPTVKVTLRDFRLMADPIRVASGPVRLVLENRGPSTHELIVVRTDRPAGGLPILPDGLTVDEHARGLRLVNQDSDIPVGTTSLLDLRLSPGHYVLFCNLGGHYRGGMHLSLVAT